MINHSIIFLDGNDNIANTINVSYRVDKKQSFVLIIYKLK